MDRFSALSRELRDEIYRELLVIDRFTFLSQGGRYRLHLAITAVNHQIHDESMEILHRENLWVSILTRERLVDRYLQPKIQYMRQISPPHIQPRTIQLTLSEAEWTRNELWNVGLGPEHLYGPLRTFIVFYDALFFLARAIRDVCLQDIAQALSTAAQQRFWPIVWINFRRARRVSDKIVGDLAIAFEQVNHVYPIVISHRVFTEESPLWRHAYWEIGSLAVLFAWFQEEVQASRSRNRWYKRAEKALVVQGKQRDAMVVLHHHVEYYHWIGKWPLMHRTLARLTREPDMTIWQNRCSAASCKLASFCLGKHCPTCSIVPTRRDFKTDGKLPMTEHLLIL